MSESMNCPECNAKRELNPEWERIWDYYDDQGQFDMNTCTRKANAEAKKYICTSCKKTSV